MFALTRNFIVIIIQDGWRGSNHGGRKISVFTVQRGCALVLWASYSSSIYYFLKNFTIVNLHFNTFITIFVIGHLLHTSQSLDTCDPFQTLLEGSNLKVDKVKISKKFFIKVDFTMKPFCSWRQHGCTLHAIKSWFIARINICIFLLTYPRLHSR